MESVENNELKNFLSNLIDNPREFGSFTAVVNDDLNVVVRSVDGWSVTYPFGSSTWACLSTWLEKWDEDSSVSFETFIKGIVFPCSVRLSDIDEEYMRGIIDAHKGLTDRLVASGAYEEELSNEEAMSDIEEAEKESKRILDEENSAVD